MKVTELKKLLEAFIDRGDGDRDVVVSSTGLSSLSFGGTIDRSIDYIVTMPPDRLIIKLREDNLQFKLLTLKSHEEDES